MKRLGDIEKMEIGWSQCKWSMIRERNMWFHTKRCYIYKDNGIYFMLKEASADEEMEDLEKINLEAGKVL